MTLNGTPSAQTPAAPADAAPAGMRARGLAIVVPASNEAATIGRCLTALVDSAVPRDLPVTVVVAANGCTDATVARAQGFAPRFEARGWGFRVLDLPEPGKIAALNAGDSAAPGAMRAYLDADVEVSKPLLGQIVTALDRDTPVFASGTVRIPRPSTAASRAYRRFYLGVPFMTHGVPGCGFFAVNAAGRARWDRFPDVIADDIFARLQFAPHERVGVPAGYEWPLVEGWSNLVRVRRRQDAGVAEIARRFPELMANEDKPPFRAGEILRRAAGDPLAFAVYGGVAAAVRLTARRAQGWSRGR
jgi:glycosyltransferase involved in cell wall biosynthesis